MGTTLKCHLSFRSKKQTENADGNTKQIQLGKHFVFSKLRYIKGISKLANIKYSKPKSLIV